MRVESPVDLSGDMLVFLLLDAEFSAFAVAAAATDAAAEAGGSVLSGATTTTSVVVSAPLPFLAFFVLAFCFVFLDVNGKHSQEMDPSRNKMIIYIFKKLNIEWEIKNWTILFENWATRLVINCLGHSGMYANKNNIKALLKI